MTETANPAKFFLKKLCHFWKRVAKNDHPHEYSYNFLTHEKLEGPERKITQNKRSYLQSSKYTKIFPKRKSGKSTVSYSICMIIIIITRWSSERKEIKWQKPGNRRIGNRERLSAERRLTSTNSFSHPNVATCPCWTFLHPSNRKRKKQNKTNLYLFPSMATQ